ncbi:MAG: electron transfer flavoprotein subunit beta [Firmicutes bacterium HGW-Firmicutes-11]|jgi:electron transfer flavoprotein beta subunit|nr:MAG: electron transfer flavoprotein subunit beta [Firmicutes bacterium HGW-Firmicutes-11]
MNIVVPIKQVPETSNVKMDPVTGTIIRDGVESIINPLDLYAIETAIQLKETYGGKVTALTMGPPAAEKALREAIAMGCDEGVLVSDRKFSGADTWSTAYVLVHAVKKLDDFDLIIAGERATDGDTGQVGPAMASALDIPLASYISRIDSVRADGMTVERLVEEGYETLEIDLPALLTVVKEISYPRLPTLRGKQKARNTELPVLTAEDLEVEEVYLGLKGSPTRVVKIETPKVTRGGTILKAVDEESMNDAIEELVEFLKTREMI